MPAPSQPEQPSQPDQPTDEPGQPEVSPYVAIYYFAMNPPALGAFHVKNSEVGWKDLPPNENSSSVFEFVTEDKKFVQQVAAKSLLGIYYTPHMAPDSKFHTVTLKTAQETAIPVFPA